MSTSTGITRRAVTIRETPAGWEILQAGCAARTIDTAGDALRTIRSEDTTAIEAGAPAAITTITWEPTTSVGGTVVRALTGDSTRRTRR